MNKRMNGRCPLVVFFSVFLLFLSTSIIHAAIIDSTGGNPAPLNYFAPFFGTPDHQIYGQTFIAPSTDTYLNNFSLYLSSRYSGSGALDLKGYIADFDSTKNSPILYTSSIQTMNAAGTLQEFFFDTGSLSLIGGHAYIAYLSVEGLTNPANSNFSMPGVDDRIEGGPYFLPAGSTYWVGIGGFDIWFKANFSASVPEPSTMLLLGSGLLGLVGYSRRRLKK